ncbi:MAG: transcription termination factor NusA [Planctomycetota bacterium]|nr:transcription termination factor NusA [Planctomycetota bacterium]
MPENQEILRLVESIHREKEVSRETVFVALESALTSACKKRPGGSSDNEVVVHIDRETGEIIAMDGDARIPMAELGRIAAQTAKQVLIQRIREAERDIIFAEYEQKVGDMVTGNVQRYDKGGLIVNLGKVEGILPRQEQIFNENYSPGERIRAIITEVRKRGNKVIIALSRTSTKLVTGLFELEVPEIGDRIIEIKDIVREPGVRTKIAVHSVDSKVDCVGACVGVRGNRIRNIVNELNGERIDIIVWSPIEENYIVNAMSPSEVIGVELDRDEGRARVIVREDQLSLAIGKKGQNVRLAAKLTNLHIDIITEAQLSEERTKFKEEMLQLPQMDDELYDRFLFNGIESVYDIVDSDIEELCEIRGVDEDLAQQLIASSEEVIAAGEMEQEEQQERS